MADKQVLDVSYHTAGQAFLRQDEPGLVGWYRCVLSSSLLKPQIQHEEQGSA